MSKTVGNFGVSEAQIVVAATVFSTAVGMMAGRNIYKMQGPSSVMGGIIGFSGGMGLAMQNSWGRLMGFFPNDAEVAKYTPLKRPFQNE